METVLITGASGGLGRSLAFEFAAEGYNIILHGRDSGRLSMVKDALKQNFPRCYTDIVVGDIRSEEVVCALAKVAEHRDLDVLVNNAGAYINRPFADMAFGDFRKLVDVNMMAPILLTLKIFPVFQRKKNGLIININSLGGRSPGDGETAYCASKYGLRGFSEALQFDAARDNIRVVEIYPGAMNTGMVKDRKELAKCIDVNDVANLVIANCKDYSSMRICGIEVKRRQY